jgi:hypothetical protein
LRFYTVEGQRIIIQQTSRLAMSRKSAPLIVDWMGHTTLATTQRYLHLAPSAVHGLVEVLEKFPGPDIRAGRVINLEKRSGKSLGS